MKNHYIPKLLLKHFAVADKIKTYDFQKKEFLNKSLKNTFSLKDVYDEKLEAEFAKKLEGPFANLLDHKLLKGNKITIDRKENFLIRKFIMVQNLRSPFLKESMEEVIRRTRTENYPSVKVRDFLLRHHPEMEEKFDRFFSKEDYIPNLRKIMEVNSMEELIERDDGSEPNFFSILTDRIIMSALTFWDSEESGQEFILTKLQGITQMDSLGMSHKAMRVRVIQNEKQAVSSFVEKDLKRLFYGSVIFHENFTIFPISPTRLLVYFSPYFRAFFGNYDSTNTFEIYPPYIKKEEFNRHFFHPMRMELFKPCDNINNQNYQYTVKKLTAEEVFDINVMLLNEETEEFAFHDYNKIRDSFWHYEHKEKFLFQKKHDFSDWI